MIICAGYIRVSRIEKNDKKRYFEKVVSPKTQLESFLNYIKIENEKHPKDKWVLPNEFIKEDLDVSGYRIPYKKRKGLNDILELARNRKINKVLIYRFNRLSRRYKDQIEILDELEKYGVEVTSCTEYIQGKSATSKLQRGILGIVSQYHSDQLSEVIKDAQITMTNRGRRIGGPANWGYKFVEIKNKDGLTIQKMVPDDEVISQVKLLFSLFLKNWGSPKIAKYLNKKGIPAPSGNYWWWGTVLEIARNPVYKGYVRWGYRSTGNGKKRNRDCLIVESSFIEPIISEEKWDLAQKILDKRAYKDRRSNSSAYLLTGLSRCALCGAPIHGYSDGRKEPHTYRGYVCSKRGECKSGRISTRIIDPIVINAVYKEFISRPERIMKYVNGVNNAAKMDSLQFEKALKNIERHKEICKMKLKRWSEQLVLGKLAEEDYYNYYDDLQKEKKELDLEEKTLKERQQMSIQNLVDKETVRKILSNFNKLMQNGIIEEQKLFVQCFVKNLEFPIIDKEQRFLRIDFRFSPKSGENPLDLEFSKVRGNLSQAW